MTAGGEPIGASIEIEAPPEVVFEYFTRPELMLAWMGEHAVLDPRPGGELSMSIRGTQVRGEYVQVDPPRRLVFSWGHVGSDVLPPGSSRVEVTLTGVAGGTRVEVVHSDLPQALAAGHARGWTMFLGRLAAVGSG